MCKHLVITEYFDGIYGSTPTAFHKADVLQRAITENQAPKDQSVIVGDTKFDLIGGKTVGIKTIAVSWGFGRNETLLAENPDFIADNTQEIWDSHVLFSIELGLHLNNDIQAKLQSLIKSL